MLPRRMASLTEPPRFYTNMKLIVALLGILLFALITASQARFIPKKQFPKSRLELSRRSQSGSFYDVVGRRSAAFGYEHRNMEAWVYPMKIVDDLEFYFKIDGYNLPFRGSDLLTAINVRPEATTFTYSHAAFTVKEIVYAPVNEQGLIILLDINTRLPMSVDVSFRPKLALAWPGNLMTGFYGQDEKDKYYFIGEETQKFYGIVGTPGATDLSLMPYQEEPRDVPVRYQIRITPDEAEKNFVPVVIAGSTEGKNKAVEVYNRLMTNALPLYEHNVKYYEDFLERTTQIMTPDERLNTAFAWAKIGTEKGVATNPFLGTGLLAGFRTSGDSERPGFAWYFGRDSMWTALALNSYGDFATTKSALEFLKKYQRDDGKIPHEISQSATLVDWWKGYPYAWNSTDATPLYVIVHSDHYRATGDMKFLTANWESIVKAYKYEETTDTDGNGLMENTKFGHGWVEGGALYPPHEEIYLQGVWIEASRNMAEMAAVLGDKATAERARANAERTRAAMENVYWLDSHSFYAYATQLPRKEAVKAEPGPNLEQRQKRLNELQNAKIYDEDTVLPAVPMWWRLMENNERAQKQIDRLGSARIATDWGARILANDSQLYDPLSYHYGSVWGLFTGWQSIAAYNYGRPHIGYQALMANALLTYTNALGYVTELLSGDFNTPFGRSSHHQVWSEAMVVLPVMRGMLGITVSDGGRTVRFSPQVPADWNVFEVKGVRAGGSTLDFEVSRSPGRTSVSIYRNGESKKLILAPAFPPDAKIGSVSVNRKKVIFNPVSIGDVQRAEISVDLNYPVTEVVFENAVGTEVFYSIPSLVAGADSSGLRIIRATALQTGLSLSLEGASGKAYSLQIKSPRSLISATGASVEKIADHKYQMSISFPAYPAGYTKRLLFIPYGPSRGINNSSK
ncbi:MAG: amylo-alpha-1,6-glucosidase [Acidobacteria bacterium]|nr:amylo-alpha-1,6-glucosidase [Acidobacteriota bacterium]